MRHHRSNPRDVSCAAIMRAVRTAVATRPNTAQPARPMISCEPVGRSLPQAPRARGQTNHGSSPRPAPQGWCRPRPCRCPARQADYRLSRVRDTGGNGTSHAPVIREGGNRHFGQRIHRVWRLSEPIPRSGSRYVQRPDAQRRPRSGMTGRVGSQGALRRMAGHEDTLALEWTAKCALASGTTRAEMWPTLETTGQSGGHSRYAARRFWQVSVAEDRRFELLKGCPLHAFQVRTQRSRQNGPVRDMRLNGPAARAGHPRTQANEIIFETTSGPRR
jgi:hypothetical protein